jgi:hypothetical protein
MTNPIKKEWMERQRKLIDMQYQKISSTRQFIIEKLNKLNSQDLDSEDLKDQFQLGYKQALQDVYKVLVE